MCMILRFPRELVGSKCIMTGIEFSLCQSKLVPSPMQRQSIIGRCVFCVIWAGIPGHLAQCSEPLLPPATSHFGSG